MNLEPETRRGYYISAEMKKVWAVEMELLKKLLEVCEKHHLRIYAEGGTLLGAVREQGFIPWDDDIDMAMLREDYDKLQSIAKDEFKAPYFFQSGYTDIFPKGQAKIRKDGTAAILPSDIWQKYHQGIFIDIFPLDNVPEDKDEYKKMAKSLKQEKIKMKLYCEHFISFSDIAYDFKILKILFEINRVGFNKYFRKYDEIIKHYSLAKSRFVSLISWNSDERYVREMKWYCSIVYVQFEDIRLPIPCGYHDILQKQYGDYMNPARVSNQHGEFLAIDTSSSFQDYLTFYRRKHRLDSWKIRWNNVKGHIKKCFEKTS